MGIRVCDDGDGVAFIYESTGMRPLGLAAFKDAEAAESFCQYVERAGSRTWRDAEELERLRDVWEELPRCLICEQRVIRPHEDVPDECESCCELDEDSEVDSLDAQIKSVARRYKLNTVLLTGLVRAVTFRADITQDSDLRKLDAATLRRVLRRIHANYKDAA